MVSKAWDFMKKNRMIEKGDRIVIGVSGGADSVCLLHVLCEISRKLEITVVAVHVNHGIRGEEADRDELFVKELCVLWDVEFHKYFFDVKRIADEEGLTEEEAGRNVRYQAFLEVCKLCECNKIAVAHNKNDNAETVLFNLFRGSGTKGLTGTPPYRVITTDFGNITLIRPLLGLERKEIEEYLYGEGISFQIDSTNLTEDYSRNKIRNRILSYAMKEINSAAVGNINEAALQLRETLEFVEAAVSVRYEALVKQEEVYYQISVKEFLKEPVVIQKGILRKIMEMLAGNLKDLEAKHVEAVLSLCGKQVGRYVHLPYGMIAEREYNDIKLFCEMKSPDEYNENGIMEPVKVEIPGRMVISQNHKILETILIKYENNDPIPKSSCAKWFDYDKIENAVEIRTRKEGDYIQINSSGGRKKLKDYFIDQKIPQKMRNCQILITDGNHVMWIPGEGERMSEKYKVDKTTTNVLLMKLIDLEENEDDT